MVEKATAGQVIDEFQEVLDRVQDQQDYRDAKEELIGRANLITQGGLARELNEAIKVGPEAVQKVMTRYKMEQRDRQDS
jgi:hypothetical protein